MEKIAHDPDLRVSEFVNKSPPLLNRVDEVGLDRSQRFQHDTYPVPSGHISQLIQEDQKIVFRFFEIRTFRDPPGVSTAQNSDLTA